MAATLTRAARKKNAQREGRIATRLSLVGGGASLVRKSVEPQDGLCRAIYLTDDKLNAEGFERILEQMSGEAKKV